jgi:hypothetical protein
LIPFQPHRQIKQYPQRTYFATLLQHPTAARRGFRSRNRVLGHYQRTGITADGHDKLVINEIRQLTVIPSTILARFV